jgi:hypothetical protein
MLRDAGLRSGKLTVFLDNDEAGFDRGARIRESVNRLIPRVRIRFVRAAIDEPGADATNHFEAGYSWNHVIEVDPSKLPDQKPQRLLASGEKITEGGATLHTPVCGGSPSGIGRYGGG